MAIIAQVSDEAPGPLGFFLISLQEEKHVKASTSMWLIYIVIGYVIKYHMDIVYMILLQKQTGRCQFWMFFALNCYCY